MRRALIIGGIGCGGLLALVGLLAVIGLLFVGTNNETQKQTAAEKKENEPAQPQAQEAIIRVSGTQGIDFGGSYGTASEGHASVEDTLGPEAIDYNVRVDPERFDIVTANFHKRPRQEGTLRTQIIVGDEVKKEQETTAEAGHVSVTYNPRTDD